MSGLLKIFFAVLPFMAVWFCNYTEENLHRQQIKYCMKKFNIEKMVMDLPGVVEDNGKVNLDLFNIYYDRIYNKASGHCRDFVGI